MPANPVDCSTGSQHDRADPQQGQHVQHQQGPAEAAPTDAEPHRGGQPGCPDSKGEDHESLPPCWVLPRPDEEPDGDHEGRHRPDASGKGKTLPEDMGLPCDMPAGDAGQQDRDDKKQRSAQHGALLSPFRG